MKSLRLLLLYILMGKEVAVMAVVYATLIVKGKKTIDQVPSLIRKQVEDPGRSRSHRLTTALIRRAAPLRGCPSYHAQRRIER